MNNIALKLKCQATLIFEIAFMNTLEHRSQQEPHIMLILKQLLQHTNISANALAKELQFPAPTISRLITGEVKDPRSSTLIAIADYFGITTDQLLGREALSEKFYATHHGATLIIKPPMSIPILNITQAREHTKYADHPKEWLHWQAKNHHSPHQPNHIFAVHIKNNLYEPIFNKETLIIINPDIKLESGDYILVSFAEDTNATIKKYISEGRYKYLHPLNPNLKTISFDENDCTIIGTIIETHTRFK